MDIAKMEPVEVPAETQYVVTGNRLQVIKQQPVLEPMTQEFTYDELAKQLACIIATGVSEIARWQDQINLIKSMMEQIEINGGGSAAPNGQLPKLG